LNRWNGECHIVLTRRQFIQTAAMAGAAAAVPPVFESLWQAAKAAPGSFFFQPESWATCQALCARIVPTGANPVTDPGATESDAVLFIDRFVAAFELPVAVADNPAIYIRGRFSGRNPFPGANGQPSSDFLPDEFLTDGARGHFLGLTPAQELSWRCQLYGEAALTSAPSWVSPAWKARAAAQLPAPGGLRQMYLDGLAAFDTYSESLFLVPFAQAAPPEQDLMLAIAGNFVPDALAVSLPSPPAAPPAAQALVPVITLHTFQATYGLPEYSWRSQDDDPTIQRLTGTAEWRAIDYTGDTQPLGNSIYDPGLYAPGEGPNEGFGEEGVYVPSGGYVEFRPVSTLDEGGTVIGAPGAAAVSAALDSMKAKLK
jgi:hypothetical protein